MTLVFPNPVRAFRNFEAAFVDDAEGVPDVDQQRGKSGFARAWFTEKQSVYKMSLQ